MNPTKIIIAIVNAQTFIDKARIAKTKLEVESYKKNGCKETAACRRASMELSRSLSELRKPG